MHREMTIMRRHLVYLPVLVGATALLLTVLVSACGLLLSAGALRGRHRYRALLSR
jgi:hypothetical protein